MYPIQTTKMACGCTEEDDHHAFENNEMYQFYVLNYVFWHIFNALSQLKAIYVHVNLPAAE